MDDESAVMYSGTDCTSAVTDGTAAKALVLKESARTVPTRAVAKMLIFLIKIPLPILFGSV
jgi:hypothetical protein